MYLLDQFREFLTSLKVFLRGVPLGWRVPLASHLLYHTAANWEVLHIGNVRCGVLLTSAKCYKVPTTNIDQVTYQQSTPARTQWVVHWLNSDPTPQFKLATTHIHPPSVWPCEPYTSSIPCPYWLGMVPQPIYMTFDLWSKPANLLGWNVKGRLDLLLEWHPVTSPAPIWVTTHIFPSSASLWRCTYNSRQY